MPILRCGKGKPKRLEEKCRWKWSILLSDWGHAKQKGKYYWKKSKSSLFHQQWFKAKTVSFDWTDFNFRFDHWLSSWSSTQRILRTGSKNLLFNRFQIFHYYTYKTLFQAFLSIFFSNWFGAHTITNHIHGIMKYERMRTGFCYHSIDFAVLGWRLPLEEDAAPLQSTKPRFRMESGFQKETSAVSNPSRKEWFHKKMGKYGRHRNHTKMNYLKKKLAILRKLKQGSAIWRLLEDYIMPF